ncbi:putative bifunctional diguanylate cyclase/phosphodiesterase [Novosphingobium beihaiensis]|uniref:EAL domain-containing protein n=1 Tax=Novosphingobium beihaiensis TaxID=2930389 RepID=A0ABT0BKZ7_9SPHN|nr:GGDEF and EAL domain-containing protein [Novosphingobium beihaiensis]MCJ2185728.1 EAL domain-containing protein [Novosphingobium beihaiensis]
MKILVVDDEEAVREAYRHVLAERRDFPPAGGLTAMARDLFGEDVLAGEDAPAAAHPVFDVHFASQGLDAVAMVQNALDRNDPFKAAFIDVRMPPGIDGRETARRIRAIDSDINLVIVTAYSDHSATDIATVAGPADKIFYISKPFSSEEIRQMALALCQRWDNDTGQLELLRQKVAELATSEARARHAALHDSLTGAANRMAFLQELSCRITRGDTGFALAIIDLDRFKHVNDTFGHGAGDDLLIAVYDILHEQVPPHSMVARLGGDEFGLLLPADQLEEAQAICAHLVESCSRSFSVFGNSARIGASCGLMMPKEQPYRDASELMRFADLALFAAKRDGRERVCVFDGAMDESQRFRQVIEGGLRRAIAEGELSLHYQPIVERDDLKTVGFEALLRWNSPESGPISPAIFIPIAEESGLIDDLGEWVVDHALKDCAGWPDLFVSINFSPRQFKRANFVEWLDARVAHAQVAPRNVQIEITETAIFEDTSWAADVLRELQAKGYRIALDDFGTGYSSLFNIKNFSLNCLKIDKSFIEGLGHDRHSAAIVSSVIHLARALGLYIIAEGVETDEQCQVLRLTGCSHMQGFLFGKPANAAETADQVQSLPEVPEPGQRPAAIGG